MTLDLAKVRFDTPGVQRLVHFNNAGSSLPPQPVVNAMIDHLRLEAELGGYESAAQQQGVIEDVYDGLAELLNCERGEIAFVENATRAWDMAFYSIPFKKGDRILTAQAEYGSNYIAYLQMAARTGAVVEAIPNDASGQVDVNELRNMIDGRVKLIAVTHIPTNGGLVNPAAEIGRVAREAGVLYLLDACQSAGQLPLDVQAIGCDMLSATGRKYLRGPRSTGFLYVRKERLPELEPPFLDLHAATWVARDRIEVRPDARKFENWEMNYAGKIGLGVAVRYALGLGVDAIWERTQTLAAHLRRSLAAIPGVTVRDVGSTQCGIVTFTSARHTPDALKAELAARPKRINVTTTTVLGTRLDMEERGLASMTRASVHYYNTEDEVAELCAAIG